jgi:hypothetical protein
VLQPSWRKRTQLLEHVIRYSAVDVLPVEIQRDEHQPRPESDFDVQLLHFSFLPISVRRVSYLAHEPLLFLGTPSVVRIKSMATLVPSLVVDSAPVLFGDGILENVIKRWAWGVA